MPQFSQIASLVQFGTQLAERNKNVSSADSPNFRDIGPGGAHKSASTSLIRPLREVKKKRHIPKWDSSTNTPASPSRSTQPPPIGQHKSTKNTSTATATTGSESTPCLPRTQALDKAQRHAGGERPVVYFTPSSTLTLPQAAKHQKPSAGMGDTLTTTCGSESTLNWPQATSTTTHAKKNQRPGGEAVTAYPHDSSPSSWSQSASPSHAKNKLSTTDYGNLTISTTTGSPSNVVSKLEALDQVKSVRIQALEKSLYESFDDGRNRSEDDEPPPSTPASPKNLKEGYLAERQLKIATQEHKDRKKYVEQVSIKIEAHERKRSMIMQELLTARSPKSPHEKQREWELQHVLTKINCNLKKEQAALDAQAKEINDLKNLIRTLVFKVESWRNLKREQRIQKSADALDSAKQNPSTWKKHHRTNLSLNEEMLLQLSGYGVRDLTWNNLHSDEIAHLLTFSPRTAISLTLIRCKGSKEKAFKYMDINENGRVSAKELRDSLVSLKIPWEKMLREAGLPRPNNPLSLYRLYDVYDNAPELEVSNLFGNFEGVRPHEEDLNRCSTPDAWSKWCKNTSLGRRGKRKPLWYIDKTSMDEVLQTRNSAVAAETRKEWMKATIQRLKAHGVPGTACRELVARHLPRGKGPKDCHGIHLIDSKTVQAERKAYNDKVQRPVKKIQTLVKDMMVQRRELSQARTDLYNVAFPHSDSESETESECEPITERDAMLELEEERKRALVQDFVSPIEKKAGKGKDAAKEDEGPSITDPLASDPEVLKKMKEYSVSQRVSNKCLKEFRKYDLNFSDSMEKGEFMRYIRDHAHGESLSESDYESAWREVLYYLDKKDKQEDVTKGMEAVFKAVNLDKQARKEVGYIQFLVWYADKEARLARSSPFQAIEPEKQEGEAPPNGPSVQAVESEKQEGEAPPNGPSVQAVEPEKQEGEAPPNGPSIQAVESEKQEGEAPPNGPSVQAVEPEKQEGEAPPNGPSVQAVEPEVHAVPSSISASFPPSSKAGSLSAGSNNSVVNSACGTEATNEVLDNETYSDAAVHAMFENVVPTPPSITASFPPSSNAGSLSAGSNNSAVNSARNTEATNEVIDNETYSDAAVHAMFENVVGDA